MHDDSAIVSAIVAFKADYVEQSIKYSYDQIWYEVGNSFRINGFPLNCFI